MKTVLITLAIVLAASGLTWSATPAPSPGIIAGRVENFTGGRRPVAGQQVKLTAYVNNAEADWSTATTDARGAFTFSVSTAPERIYMANVLYKGGEYDSEPVTFKAGERRKSLALRVYEPTTDAGILRVNIHHMIVQIGAGAVQVAELLVLANPTDRTYIGATVRPDGKRETLLFSIPQGAGTVEYLEGLAEDRVFRTDRGLVDTLDVKPGMREIGYSYTLPYSRGDLRIVRAVDYPTDRVELFGSTQAQMQVVPLAAQGPVTTEQGTYARFSGGAMRPQQEIAILLTGLPVANSMTRALAIALFVGVIAAALVYPLLRRRRRALDPNTVSGPGPARTTDPATKEALIAAIARLDDEYEAGRIARVQYEADRTRYKSMLLGLLQAAGSESHEEAK